MAKHGGWAGKVLRVDLSTGKISTEDTLEKYRDYLGGTGIGYKVLWDEVSAGTRPFDPENKVVFATGPLAGTGAPCNGRTAITTLWPTCWPTPLVASGHMGGHFAAELKYAGYDAVIVEGPGGPTGVAFHCRRQSGNPGCPPPLGPGHSAGDV